MLYNILRQKRIRIAYKAEFLPDLNNSYKESVLWCLSISQGLIKSCFVYTCAIKYNTIYIKPSRVSSPSLRRQHDFCMIYIHFSLYPFFTRKSKGESFECFLILWIETLLKKSLRNRIIFLWMWNSNFLKCRSFFFSNPCAFITWQSFLFYKNTSYQTVIFLYKNMTCSYRNWKCMNFELFCLRFGFVSPVVL